MENDKANLVRVVQRAFGVLEAFDEQSPQLSLHEISERIGLPKTTTFRLLATLVDTGYVVQAAGQEYHLSHKILRLGSVAQRGFNIFNVAHPVMVQIAARTLETLDLSVLRGTQRICLDVVESPHSLKNIIRPGDAVDLHLAATGKVFLAFAKAPLLEESLGRAGPSFDAARLLRDLETVRQRGYAVSSGERVVGASAVSVPLRNAQGAVDYCLTVSGPTFRFSERLDEFIHLMLAGGREISDRLGSSAAQKSAPVDAPPGVPKPGRTLAVAKRRRAT
jgi:IclR family transcriptional regulator, KDG regulon repressor